MKRVTQHIPNFITLLNLTTGVFGIVLSIDQPILGCGAVFLAALFDVMDGLVARRLNVVSAIGKDLDSLADLVSFGVLPTIFSIGAFNMLVQEIQGGDDWKTVIFCIFLTIPALSALRLTRFNHDPEQKNYFKGLPTPANGLFLSGLCLFVFTEGSLNVLFMDFPWIFALLVMIPALMLNAPFQLLSFKISPKDGLGIKMMSLLIFLSISLAIFLGFGSVMIILPLYFIISFINRKLHEIQSRN